MNSCQCMGHENFKFIVIKIFEIQADKKVNSTVTDREMERCILPSAEANSSFLGDTVGVVIEANNILRSVRVKGARVQRTPSDKSRSLAPPLREFEIGSP